MPRIKIIKTDYISDGEEIFKIEIFEDDDLDVYFSKSELMYLGELINKEK